MRARLSDSATVFPRPVSAWLAAFSSLLFPVTRAHVRSTLKGHYAADTTAKNAAPVTTNKQRQPSSLNTTSETKPMIDPTQPVSW